MVGSPETMRNWADLFGTTSAWVGIVDSAGRLVWMNEAFERGSGYEVSGLPLPAGTGRGHRPHFG